MLSEDVQSRGRRALLAAEAQLDAGQPPNAQRLISVAPLAAQTELDVAQREVLEARVAYVRGRGRDAPALLLSAAMRLDARRHKHARHLSSRDHRGDFRRSPIS